MFKNLLLLISAVLMLSACGSDDCCKKDAKGGEAAPTSQNGNKFGEAFSTEGAVTYDEMLTQMGTSDSLAIKVKGKVSEVCQVKGCWMDIVSDDASKPAMKVKFKDYAFFMPKDLAGKQVVVNGYAFTEVTSVEELKHMAEDAKKSKEEIEKITAPAKELKFMASGVEILN